MSLSVYELHPLVVHLPIGLLILAVVLDLAAWFGGRASLATAARWLYLGGVASAWLAVWTGDRAATSLAGPSAALRAAVTRHGDLGHVATWMLSLAGVGAWCWPGLSRRLRADRWHPARLLLLGMALGGAVLLILAAAHGAGVVFGHGGGVNWR